MLLHAVLLFFFFLMLSAFFSSSETAFLAANPYKLKYLEKKGSSRARLIHRLLDKVDVLLAGILIGNTLVNAAAASISTYIFVSLISDKNHAVIVSTVVTTVLLLALSEITPKTYAAHNPIKLSLLFVRPLQLFMILFYPLVKIFSFIPRVLFPSKQGKREASRTLSEEEIKVMLTMGGIKGVSSLRARMMSAVLDIGYRPIREIMIPRPQIKGLEINSPHEMILSLIGSAEFSRFPVYRSRIDNIEGLVHTKDLIPFLIEGREFRLSEILRKPIFIPESASLEKVLRKMQESTVHMFFVVDEFGNMEGIVTLEDIIEEIVGEIQDEYDGRLEESILQEDENRFFVRGSAPIKQVNTELFLDLPESAEYMTLAGFFLREFGRIPKAGDVLERPMARFTIIKMNRRHIHTIQVERKSHPLKEK